VSFFPARLFTDQDRFFARPQLLAKGPLDGVVNPANPQSIKAATVSTAERDAIWQEVAMQVASQGCGLGYHAAVPPLRARQDAESATRRKPEPLS